MVSYVFRKIFHTAFVAFGVITLVFAALRLSGGAAGGAVRGAHVVNTDVWASMGQEEEQAIRAARHRIPRAFRDSPQFISEPLSEELGVQVVVKLETANPIGSFKGRGTWLAIAELQSAGAVGAAPAPSGGIIIGPWPDVPRGDGFASLSCFRAL